MLNKSTSRSEYVIQSGVDKYLIDFAFQYNGDDTPQIRVTIGDMVAVENLHFVITEDLLNIKLIPLEEEAPADPNDYSWLEKWVGMSLVIERDIPFVQESDYQLGRISPERIEKDFDLSVMRDQILDDKIGDVRNEFAEADKGLSDKIDETKAELQKNIDDKLPLTGGTLTGSLTIVGDGNFTSEALILKHKANGVAHKVVVSDSGVQMPFDLFGMHGIEPSPFDGPYNLGTKYNKWGTVYTTKISNGSDISVPEKAGTMALLEDVEPKANKTDLQNYLPLAGGSFMTSWIGFDGTFSPNENRGIITVQTANGVKGIIGAATDENGKFKDVVVIDKLKGTTTQYSTVLATQVGSINSHVPRVFAKKIGSGSSSKMIVIPEKAGTMACLDDIPETYTKEELDAKFAEIPESVDTYSKAEIDAKLSSVYKFKGSVANVDALPSGATVGDTYNVEDTGDNYAWDGSAWDRLAGTADLTGYATEEYVDDNTFAIMDYIDDEVKPLKTDTKQLYNNQLVLRDMLNEKDENNEFIQLTTEAQTAIPAINELNEKKASKEDLSGYLPLSGGTVAGELSIGGDGYSPVPLVLKNTQYNKMCRFGVNYVGQLIFAFSDNSTDDFVFSSSGTIQATGYDRHLGSTYYPWRKVFAEKLNNGEDLIVPAEGGTLARIEDVNAIGGEGAAGQVLTKTEDGMAWQDASGGGDYLPTAGGTLTGPIEFEWSGNYMSPYKTILKSKYHRLDTDTIESRDIAEIGTFGDVRFFSTTYSNGFWPSQIGGVCSLGNTHYCYGKTFTQKINAGRQNNVDSGDLIVPTKGGTLARLEDLEGLGGGLSDKLGFNTDAGYLYFKDISNVDDFENLDAIALTSDIESSALSIVNRYHGVLDQGELYRFNDSFFSAGEYTTGKNLGRDEVPWMTTYTAFISAGLGAGELQLPTEEGTLARIEDIDERIGDISTVLTAILGE